MNDQPNHAGPLPDTATLANLAAQARFSELTPQEAAAEALELWRAADTLLKAEHDKDTHGAALGRWVYGLPPGDVPMPKTWPATLQDFYKSVVRGKDETESQPRFKRFLRYRVETDQTWLRAEMSQIPEAQRTDESTPSPWNTNKFRLLGTFEHLDNKAVDREVEREFAKYKSLSFEAPRIHDRHEWSHLAEAYLHWWKVAALEGKRKGGLATQAKKAEEKKKRENTAATLDTRKTDSAAAT
jgi:hypothetical protein